MDKSQEERLGKLVRLRAMGVNPYPYSYRGREAIGRVCKRLEEEGGEFRATVSGRIMALRHHGKSAFLDIQDFTGKVQVYLQKNLLGEEKFELYLLLDLGDIIGIQGKVGRTRTGEITIFADSLVLLAKALLPLPEKFHGLKDKEIRYRRRYLDLITNQASRDSFITRSRIIGDIRIFFEERGFLEVETPMMHPIAGGAAARPFVTYHNTLKMELFLRIAPELYLKRLLVGGIEKVFEINRNFRNEGISTKHNPEFTMLEAYEAYADYNDMMDLTEALFTFLFEKYRPGERFRFGDQEVCFAKPFPRKPYAELFREHVGFNLEDEAGILQLAKDMQMEVEGQEPAKVAQEVFEQKVEPSLVNPTFVVDYPKAICPLAKEKEGASGIAERFELFLCGMEMANAFSELNDPVEQEKRFQDQVNSRDVEAPREVDSDYIAALKQGMPPAGGLGIGIDRLIMVLLDLASIRDVILFPLLRPEGGTQAISGASEKGSPQDKN